MNDALDGSLPRNRGVHDALEREVPRARQRRRADHRRQVRQHWRDHGGREHGSLHHRPCRCDRRREDERPLDGGLTHAFDGGRAVHVPLHGALALDGQAPRRSARRDHRGQIAAEPHGDARLRGVALDGPLPRQRRGSPAGIWRGVRIPQARRRLTGKTARRRLTRDLPARTARGRCLALGRSLVEDRRGPGLRARAGAGQGRRRFVKRPGRAGGMPHELRAADELLRPANLVLDRTKRRPYGKARPLGLALHADERHS